MPPHAVAGAGRPHGARERGCAARVSGARRAAVHESVAAITRGAQLPGSAALRATVRVPTPARQRPQHTPARHGQPLLTPLHGLCAASLLCTGRVLSMYVGQVLTAHAPAVSNVYRVAKGAATSGTVRAPHGTPQNPTPRRAAAGCGWSLHALARRVRTGRVSPSRAAPAAPRGLCSRRSASALSANGPATRRHSSRLNMACLLAVRRPRALDVPRPDARCGGRRHQHRQPDRGAWSSEAPRWRCAWTVVAGTGVDTATGVNSGVNMTFVRCV